MTFRRLPARRGGAPLAALLLSALVASALPARHALAAPAAAAKAGVSAERLRSEYRENPLGVDTPRPRLSWELRAAAASERGQRQTAYQVLVARDEKTLRAGRGDLWDSGRVASDQTIAVAYGGKAPETGARCWWTVRVWDRDGNVSAYSRPAFWEMGLLRPEDRAGAWITAAAPADREAALFTGANWVWHDEGPGSPSPAQGAPAGERLFRARFRVPAGVKAATLDITADNRVTVYVNGREAGKSGDGSEDWRNPLRLEIGPLLRPGENVIAVAATNMDGPAGLIAQLRVGSDGVLTTDAASWRSAPTAPTGWQAPEFDDSVWKPVRVAAPYGEGPWRTLRRDGGVGPGRYLRREFSLGKPVRRARLYASALGVYEPYVNGKRVGSDVFAPGWTDYKKRVHYQTYDVTGHLRRGANALGIVLGDGWYAGHVGLAGRGVYGPTPLAWCRLRVEYADGTDEVVTTDGSWRGSVAGPVVGSDMLMGENYDARRDAAFAGWNAPGYREPGGGVWTAAVVGKPTAGALEAQRGPSVLRHEDLKPRGITEPKPGAYVFDLGQNMVGWAKLKVKGPAGATVRLRFAEMLNPDGTVYTTNYRSARCTDNYTLRGAAGGETYEPRFTFRGFRYVEVTGWPGGGKPGADAVTGVVLHSEMPVRGRMETSLPMVNQLLKNIDWGQRGNFLAVPTDCPQRDERLGWMGDAQIFVWTAAYNRDVAAFFDKWLVDVDDAQSAAGAFPDVAPRVAAGEGTAAWGDAGVICPWAMYVMYGDPRFLEDHYPAMTRWVDYCEKNSKDLLRPAAGYGDWLSIRADTPKDVLATAYFAYSTRLVARAAAALGKTEDARKYEALFGRIRDAFQKAYVSPDGKIKGDTQTVYLLALRFDLLPESLREPAARRLTADIAAKGGHLSTGFVGVGYLCPVLSQTGNDDVAHRLLNQETFPSWLYSIRQGATTIWERWDGWTHDKGFQDAGMNSFNHYSFGSVGEWLFGDVAGIAPDPDAPGFRRVVVRPRPGAPMTWARTSYESVRGPVRTEWRREKGRYDLKVSVPPGATATVWVASPEPARVTEGGRDARSVPGVRFVRADAGHAVFEVQSGNYAFSAPL
ncbi:MAG TPA: family 78 glycoside hydrolase catalytic domain [Armatimonadaceae bacterium]|nr:family 78 glycoside hydrolase catalytic domain [Armatimonadaceae bacterium]